MRVCHPGPAARKCLSTCGDRRMWVCTFASAFFGRPRGRVSVPCAARTTLSPTAISARSNCSSVHFGASSGSTQTRLEPRFFAGIALPHRDHVTIRATRSPDHHDHMPTEKSVSLEAGLAIVPPVIQEGECCSVKYPFGILEVQASLRQRLISFGGVVCDPHELLCGHGKYACQALAETTCKGQPRLPSQPSRIDDQTPRAVSSRFNFLAFCVAILSTLAQAPNFGWHAGDL